MAKILLVGQTPPPFGGQAIMIQKILEGNYPGSKLFHVRMAFSKEMNEMGSIGIFKILHLVEVIVKIIYKRVFTGANILYYPPAGPSKVPVYRDIVILMATRWMFKKTILHFHAGGVSEIYPSLNGIEQFFFRLSYFNPDITISLSTSAPPDAAFMKSKQNFTIPYGIDDTYKASYRTKAPISPVNILFVGVLRQTKGELVLLEAGKILADKGINFNFIFAGKFFSEKMESEFFDMVNAYDLIKKVQYKGVVTGVEKCSLFANSDIFCFPSFFEAETFGLVLVEAMQYKLPIVATRWRGIPDNVEEGENGYLVNIKDAVQLANKLEGLIINKPLRDEMGQRSREMYLEKFTSEKFQENINECFLYI